MTPVIALVGRPNVGKSTLFNRLTKSRDALVADFSGLTRDRKYGDGKLGERPFIVVDTGGISGFEVGLDAEMAGQSFQAIDEADAVLFLVDAQEGVTSIDHGIAKMLRQKNKPVWLVVNKTDGRDETIAVSDFYELGLPGEPYPIAASHNRGIRGLIDEVMDTFPFAEIPDVGAEEHWGTRIAIIGRPNVGKSTLVNRMLGEDRVVVYDQPGTTMDSIYIPFDRHGEKYTLIDTAGVRRRKNIYEATEKFSIIKSLQAIKDANVVVLVLDARDGVVEQDLHMLNFVLEAGRAMVVAVNKWDGMDQDDKARVKTELDRRMDFLFEWADFHFISAMHGTGVGDLYKSIGVAYESSMAKWQSNYLTTLLEGAVETHQPPMINGRRIKLRYAHQGGSNPPIIVIHGNQVDKLTGSYKRYLENTFKKILGIRGTPVRVSFRSGDNPFAPTFKNNKNTKVKTGPNARDRRIEKNREIAKGKND
jgi:GTP-binding protein